MCGLVGIAGGLVAQDEEPMQRMLMDDYWRGKDSTGMAAIRTSGDVINAKMASHPLHLFETPKFKQALNGHLSCAFIGHNRARTRGEVNDYNAHPFHVGHIVLAHNGTLFGNSQEKLEEAIGEKFPVDSQAIAAAVATIGIAETVKLLDGAWALTWVDLKDGSLNFLRNKDRPLWYACTKDDKFIYWASEWPTIHCGMRGEYRELKKDKDHNRYFAFAEDFHYKYSLEDFLKGKKQKPSCVKREGKKWLPLETGSSNYGVHNRSNPFKKNQSQQQNHSSTTTSRGDERTAPPFVNVDGTKNNPYAGHINEEEFKERAISGCTFCEAPVNYGDTGLTIYKKDGIILCSEHSSFADKGKSRIYVEELPKPAILAD